MRRDQWSDCGHLPPSKSLERDALDRFVEFDLHSAAGRLTLRTLFEHLRMYPVVVLLALGAKAMTVVPYVGFLGDVVCALVVCLAFLVALQTMAIAIGVGSRMIESMAKAVDARLAKPVVVAGMTFLVIVFFTVMIFAYTLMNQYLSRSA